MDDRDSAPETSLAVTGTLAGVLAAVLLVLALATGRSHALLQAVRPAAEQVALLLARPVLLRVDLALDGLLLCAYVAFFASLRANLRRWTDPARDLGPVWLGALALSALLDAVENTHVFAMLVQAEKGLPIAPGAIVMQAVASHVKLLANIGALFVLSFCLPRARPAERAIAVMLRWVQLPLGVAVLVLPASLARPVAIGRTWLLVAGLFAFASIARARARAQAAP
jgi:hypothetical protein